MHQSKWDYSEASKRLQVFRCFENKRGKMKFSAKAKAAFNKLNKIQCNISLSTEGDTQ